MKQINRDSCPTRGSEGSGVNLFKKGAPKVTLVGHHVMRPSIPRMKKGVFTRGETSTRPQPKRKGPAKIGPRAAKPKATKENEGAQLDFDPQGFIQVHLHAHHCENIAQACGIPVEQINSLLVEDNTERVIQQQLSQQDAIVREQEQGEHLSDFEPHTEDELNSESD